MLYLMFSLVYTSLKNHKVIYIFYIFLSMFKDVEITESKARELYWDLALIVRRIYHDCKLVHGDLVNIFFFFLMSIFGIELCANKQTDSRWKLTTT